MRYRFGSRFIQAGIAVSALVYAVAGQAEDPAPFIDGNGNRWVQISTDDRVIVYVLEREFLARTDAGGDFWFMLDHSHDRETPWHISKWRVHVTCRPAALEVNEAHTYWRDGSLNETDLQRRHFTIVPGSAGEVWTQAICTGGAPAVPTPITPILVTTDDYPIVSLRAGEQGRVDYVLTIGGDGRPVGCRIAASSSFPNLDMATCRNLLRRARFTPVAGEYSGSIAWSLPNN